MPFWGEIARVGRPTAKVIVFEAFKRSQNLKAWSASLHRGCKAAMRCGKKKKKILASYCTRSVVCVIATVKLQCGFRVSRSHWGFLGGGGGRETK